MLFTLTFPNIDPILIEIPAFDLVLVEIPSIPIRWYSLAYIAGLLLGWRLMRRLAQPMGELVKEADVDDFLLWATAGVILGGRVGYILFYGTDYYLDNPMQILEVWKGGMSFHGGFLGIVLVAIIFCRRRKIPILIFGDLIACVAPIGLFFGRIANFANAELFGRISEVPWAMVFPGGGSKPRHPSQLYEAGLEGAALFILLALLSGNKVVRQRFGTRMGIFMIGYGLARSFVELYREPDAHLGFVAGDITMGQILSLPMLLIGIIFVFYARRSDEQNEEK